MGTSGHRSKYLAAFEEANAELDELFHQFEWLQRRKEQIEDVLMALEPFLSSAAVPARKVHDPALVLTLPVSIESTPETSELGQSLAADRNSAVSERFVAAAETELDPIQRRINRALGLAVA